jgi:hypothetical protein
LHDPERARWKRRRLAVDDDVDGKSGCPHLLDERVEPGQAGLRLEALSVVTRAQQGDEPPHLHERITAGRSDRLERGPSLAGIVVEDPSCSLRLQHDHSECVPDDVVKLARDACALLDDVRLGRPPCPIELLLAEPTTTNQPPEHPLLRAATRSAPDRRRTRP